jgi:5-guanidino-2-oxopentanoate decarboxylase
MTQRCGVATLQLLARYGVDTVFGIPGVHTLEFCRGLDSDQSIRHIRARHEQGAGFMADGYARASGKPGVALVISGPGVTNAATALGQSYADSIPVLLLSAEPPTNSLGKGFGVLHEITSQSAVTAPLTAFSATAYTPQDIPDLLRRAFAVFNSARPRPVHISIPTDVLERLVEVPWVPAILASRPYPDPGAIRAGAEALSNASRALIMLGGGAIEAGEAITAIAERIGAVVTTSSAGKGIVSDMHPLNVGASQGRAPVHQLIADADVVLAIGTEISETDTFIERLTFNGTLIRADIDPAKVNDLYPADIGIVADANATATALLAALETSTDKAGPVLSKRASARANKVRASVTAGLSPTEQQHVTLLDAIRRVLPPHGMVFGDTCQLVYTGTFAMPVTAPRRWHYPTGFCTLGCGLPNAIGAQVALPQTPIIALAGDGGFMFTMQELVLAAELQLPLAIVIWDNQGLQQIRDDMRARQLPQIGVDGLNPDFEQLAHACFCHAAAPNSMSAFEAALASALEADRPTVIVVRENTAWLCS